MKLTIITNFIDQLPADDNPSNEPRQVNKACFSYVAPQKPSNPVLIHANLEFAKYLEIPADDVNSEEFLRVFSGAAIYPKTKPYALAYAGHQFGNWAGQLGDGRAINLMQISANKQLFTLQLKGAGPTPYSRNADGFAVLRSSIREYLCAEAMHYLGVPTTRSLSLVLSGDEVLRDVLYNGNTAYEKGAIVCRVAPSFIRFGSFELLFAQNDLENLKKLVDYTIEHHFEEIKTQGTQKYLDFFEAVSNATLTMIVHWQRVGFVHGVMNTDNMSVHGITIDYGPYGWLEEYNPGWTPNTTDSQHKRYNFGNQPDIGLWNLYKLANALYPIIEDATALEAILNGYETEYKKQYLEMMGSKLGLYTMLESDLELIENLTQLLQLSPTDMTIFFRNLASVCISDTSLQALEKISEAFYDASWQTTTTNANWQLWLQHYLERLQLETVTDANRKLQMNAVNPKYVFRNYMAHLCIEAAEKGDYSLITDFLNLLKNPYQEQAENQQWFAKRPDWAKNKVGCSMLSCSS